MVFLLVLLNAKKNQKMSTKQANPNPILFLISKDEAECHTIVLVKHLPPGCHGSHVIGEKPGMGKR